MTIFNDSLDLLTDVNDYAEVDINKIYITAGGRINNSGSPVQGVRGGVAVKFEKLHLGVFYDGRFWDGHSNETHNARGRQDEADTGLILDNHFRALIGNKTIGGIMLNLDLDNMNINTNIVHPETAKVNSGFFSFGGVWGKNFSLKNRIIKPELGFLTRINIDKTEIRDDSFFWKGDRNHSELMFILGCEYLFAANGGSQTTIGFGDIPLIALPYTDEGPPEEKTGGCFYNTAYGEFKQVYSLTDSLSLGYLAGLSLAINRPKDADFEIGFLPRASFGLVYKISEKIAFSAGARLGSLNSELITFDSDYYGYENRNPLRFGSHNDSMGFFYTKKETAGYKNYNWHFLPFRGAWGLGVLWKPEKIFTADFSIDSKLNGAGGFNFNVQFTLNL